MAQEKRYIMIDDREGDVLINDLIRVGFIPEIKRLNSADYVYKDVGIERKTIDDFCESIKDGRIEHQVERMKEVYKYCFVIISGRISERKSKINENCILGKIVSLIVKHNVPTIMVENNKQLAYIIGRIAERREEKNATN